MLSDNLDPSMVGAAKYERIENDFYPTPAWCTDVLVRHVTFGPVWEPACGNGAIAKVLADYGMRVLSTDLIDRGYGEGGRDFFLETNELHDIVTNPPYGDLAEAFIRHALALTKPHKRKVAMLMRNEWDSASSRSDLYAHPYAMKIVLTKRPRWIEGSTGAPRHNYAWFVWDWQHEGRPVLVHDQ